MTGIAWKPAGVPGAWNRCWFDEVPPHVFALLRIAFGLLGLLGLAGVTPVSMYWSPDGLAPVPGPGVGLRAAVQAAGLGWLAGAAFFAVMAASFLAMTVGYRSALAVPACFFGSVLQSHWNHLPLSSAHQVTVTLLFCLMWADTGAAWSVDRWLARRRGGSGRWERQPVWPLRLFQCQVALVYLSAGLWKLAGPMWRDGSAVHWAASLNTFHRLPIADPPEAASAMTVLTYLTLLWELAFAPMLLLRATRRLALLAGVCVHLGLWLVLEIGPFSWVMLASYLAFLDPHAAARVPEAVRIGPLPPRRSVQPELRTSGAEPRTWSPEPGTRSLERPIHRSS
jgi:hypothetical protein